MLSVGTSVRFIGKREVDMKLLAAAPRILAENRAMVTQMLEQVKAEITPGTPLGPGHFGVHLRDSYKVEVSSQSVKTTGTLKAPPQGFWREFGTRSRYRGKANRLRAYTAAFERGLGAAGGEKAGLFATKALNGVRRLIRLYYGNAQWWRL